MGGINGRANKKQKKVKCRCGVWRGFKLLGDGGLGGLLDVGGLLSSFL